MEKRNFTERPSPYRHLEKMSTIEILSKINREDQTVAHAVTEVIDKMEPLVEAITQCMLNGGRLIYVGAGTSGRLGVLDASECPPTYGVSPDLVIGVMAGGDQALRNGIEDVEDDPTQGVKDMQFYKLQAKDVVVGIAASGRTPYVIGALQYARELGAKTGCIVCNKGTEIAKLVDHPIEVIVGPEFVTGSTRMKSGTAQKLVLNMLSTSVMIRLGLVEDNEMVNMQISNTKLVDRGVRMLMNQSGITDYTYAKKILLENGSVKLALVKLKEQL
jgi:N-acetylmuramic acid 6-phosphate etherase